MAVVQLELDVAPACVLLELVATSCLVAHSWYPQVVPALVAAPQYDQAVIVVPGLPNPALPPPAHSLPLQAPMQGLLYQQHPLQP